MVFVGTVTLTTIITIVDVATVDLRAIVETVACG